MNKIMPISREDAHHVSDKFLELQKEALKRGFDQTMFTSLILSILIGEFKTCKACFLGEVTHQINLNRTLPLFCPPDKDEKVPTHTCNTQQ